MDERGTAFDAVERRDTDGPMPTGGGTDAAFEEAGAAEVEGAEAVF